MKSDWAAGNVEEEGRVMEVKWAEFLKNAEVRAEEGRMCAI